MTSRPGQIARALRAADRLDQGWGGRIPEDPATRMLYTPWMPFNNREFLALLLEAIPDAVEAAGDDPKFLDIGCGPGPKLLLARDVFGLAAHGIERVPAYAAAARSLGLDAENADADGWTGYGRFDLIWFYRPFRDPARQAVLERQVWHGMKPGAVVLCAGLEAPPPPSWIIILDDLETRRWIWQKPLPAPAGGYAGPPGPGDAVPLQSR